MRGDLTAAWPAGPGFELRMNMQNVANKRFYESVYPAHIVPGAGRTFLFTGTCHVLRSRRPMILPLRQVLTEAQVARCRELMERATWVDGRVTAGHQSAGVKDNRQIPEGSPEAREMGETIVAGARAPSPVRLRRRCRAASFRRSSTATSRA